MSTQDAGAATGPVAKPTPRWQTWTTRIVAVVFLLIGVIKIISAFTGEGLPACDSRRAKDTLSDVFKDKQLKPTTYDEIKTLSSSKDLVECEAKLPTADATLDVKYKFFIQGDQQRYEANISSTPK